MDIRDCKPSCNDAHPSSNEVILSDGTLSSSDMMDEEMAEYRFDDIPLGMAIPPLTVSNGFLSVHLSAAEYPFGSSPFPSLRLEEFLPTNNLLDSSHRFPSFNAYDSFSLRQSLSPKDTPFNEKVTFSLVNDKSVSFVTSPSLNNNSFSFASSSSNNNSLSFASSSSNDNSLSFASSSSNNNSLSFATSPSLHNQSFDCGPLPQGCIRNPEQAISTSDSIMTKLDQEFPIVPCENLSVFDPSFVPDSTELQSETYSTSDNDSFLSDSTSFDSYYKKKTTHKKTKKWSCSNCRYLNNLSMITSIDDH